MKVVGDLIINGELLWRSTEGATYIQGDLLVTGNIVWNHPTPEGADIVGDVHVSGNVVAFSNFLTAIPEKV